MICLGYVSGCANLIWLWESGVFFNFYVVRTEVDLDAHFLNTWRDDKFPKYKKD